MNSYQALLHRIAVIVVLLIGFVTLVGSTATAQELNGEHAPNSQTANGKELLSFPAGTLVSLDMSLRNWKQVHKGDTVEGHLALPAYATQQAALPRGTAVRITIESIEPVRDKGGMCMKIGRAIIKAFNPLENSVAPEYSVKVKAAEIVLPGGQSLPITVYALRAGTGITIRPERQTIDNAAASHLEQESANHNENEAHSRMLLRLEETILLPASIIMSVDVDRTQPESRAGKGRAFLWNALSATRSRKGDLFQAVLAEPVHLGARTFDAGSMVEGRVVRSTPPRILSRAGLLYLRADRLVSRDQTVVVNGVLDATEAGPHAAPVLDEEGMLRGRKPGVKNALVDMGVAYAVGKVSDDVAETPIRAVGAAISDAAVANAARYFGIGASAVFLVTRHGRDVRLAKYAEVDFDFAPVNQPEGPSPPDLRPIIHNRLNAAARCEQAGPANDD